MKQPKGFSSRVDIIQRICWWTTELLQSCWSWPCPGPVSIFRALGWSCTRYALIQKFLLLLGLCGTMEFNNCSLHPSWLKNRLWTYIAGLCCNMIHPSDLSQLGARQRTLDQWIKHERHEGKWPQANFSQWKPPSLPRPLRMKQHAETSERLRDWENSTEM